MYKWFLLLLPFSAFAQEPAYDILIRNGKIIDGTGNSWYYGNVGVKDGKIVKAGRAVLDSTAAIVIDAVYQCSNINKGRAELYIVRHCNKA